MAFCQNSTPPQGPPHLFLHHSSQFPSRVEWVAGFAMWQVVVAALSPHLLNRLLLLSFPQGCSESEEFIHTNLTRNEDNVLGGKPIYLFSVGDFCGLKAGMVVYTSIPFSGSTSSQRIWRLPPDVCQGTLFSGQRRKWPLGDDSTRLLILFGYQLQTQKAPTLWPGCLLPFGLENLGPLFFKAHGFPSPDWGSHYLCRRTSSGQLVNSKNARFG